MMVPINNLGQVGVIRDTPAHKLPANVWTDARGVRFYDNAVWKAFGQETVLGTPTVDPYYLYHHLGPSNNYWAYPGLEKIYATDGIAHNDITRSVGGDYTGSANDIWQATHLGGIEIFNNGLDEPQAWINPALGTPVVDLANWPATTSARTIKSFKQYLIALNVTKSGTHFPYLVKWSHVADPGTVPSSWDETDPALDAGEYPLAETGGHILDGVSLQDQFLIYKEDQTWTMSYIGGRFIFSLVKRFDTGIVSSRCVVEYKAKHYVATAEDILVHDGFQQESLLDDRMRRWYVGQVDPDYANRQFMVYNEREHELWMCLPQAGHEYPNIALVVNMKDGTQDIRDLDHPTYIATGPYEAGAGNTTYDSQLTKFDLMQGTFGQRIGKPGTKRLVGSHRLGTARFVLYDEGFGNEGNDFRGYCERTSMPLGGVSRDGVPVMDASTVKQVNEIWPELRIQNGTEVDVYVGGQDTLNDPITWEGPLPFTVGADDKVDCCTTGRYLSFRFETTDMAQWKLDSYAVNLEVLGRY
jgi:hypothetical protein